jgi:hypothetical protein
MMDRYLKNRSMIKGEHRKNRLWRMLGTFGIRRSSKTGFNSISGV